MTRSIIGLLAALFVVQTLGAQEPARTEGWVVLPLDEYRTLRARAFPSPPAPAPPPVDAAVTRIDYDLRLTGDTVGGEVRLTVDVLKEGWVRVKVPQGMLVRDARIEGRRIALIDGTPPSVLIPRTGRSTLVLDVVVPLATSAGSESFMLPESGSALSAIRIAIPRTSVDLTVEGGFVADETELAAESRWTVYGTPGRPLIFSWKKKTDDRRTSLPLRTRARITQLVGLGEESSQVTASVRIEVTQGAARQVDLLLPEGLVVNQVQGASVGDWSQADCSLTISFLDPVVSETAFIVSAEARTPREGAVTIPIVRLPAAERETGGVAVDVVGPGEISGRQPQGLEPADPSDLDDIVSGRSTPSMAAFRFKPLPGTSARALTVTVSRYTAQAVLIANIEEARYEALVAEDGKTLVRVRYAVRNNQRSFLALTLPPQSVLWSTSLGGQPVRPGVSSGGGLLLPLQKGRSGEEAPTFVVELLYLQRTPAWVDKGEARLELPAVDLPVSRTALSLHHSPRFQIEPRPGAFRVENDPGPWSAAMRAGASTPPPPPPPASPRPKSSAEADVALLMDRFNKEAGRASAGIVPVEVKFPEFGPSIFLAAELTAEAQTPAVEVAYARKGGR